MISSNSTKPVVYRTLAFDPQDMALRGRIGAYRLHATHDAKETTKPARAAFMTRFETEVDPDGVLSLENRSRRAESAKKGYFAQLARKSVKARRQRAAKGKGTDYGN